jgi:tRNA A58 N-methylase Trm61
VEIDRKLVELARANARDAGVADKVTFVQGDLFDTDFSSASVVALYLVERLNARLEPKLRQLRPGSRIVSHQAGIGQWKPDATITVDESVLHLWRLPRTALSEWAIAEGD